MSVKLILEGEVKSGSNARGEWSMLKLGKVTVWPARNFQFKDGQTVRASVSFGKANEREFNGKKFTDINIYLAECADDGTGPEPSFDDLPI